MIPYSYLRDHQLVEPADEAQERQDFPRFVRAGPKASQFNPADVLDTLASEAIKFIDSAAKKDGPFFLYLPLTSPHKPAWPHQRFVGTTALGPYGDFVHQTDATIGQIIAALEKNRVADNTLVIVTSDNGSYMKRTADDKEDHVELPAIQGYRKEHHQPNGKWRGTKADIWEAGHRVPFLVRWPGRVPPNSSSDRPTVMTDVFATIAEVLGQKVPPAAEDSFSFQQEMTGSESAERPPLILHSSRGMFAIRDGDWKLVLGNGSGGREQPQGKPFERPYFLANLVEDPAETTNLAAQQSKVVERLEESFKQIAGDWKNSR
jgi:arylsulfatase A-like enzyme